MDLLVNAAASRSVRRFSRSLVLLALAFAGVSSRSTAQENPCLRRTIPVNVTTEDYRPVSGLTPANFRGKFRGKPVEIMSAKCDTGPRRIVILLDASGSMQYAWEAELEAAHKFALEAPLKDDLAVLTFAERAHFGRIEFGQSRDAMVQGLAKLWKTGRPYGQTALLDALLEAIVILHPVRTGDAILLITDGEDNASRSDPREAKSRILLSGVRLFGLMLDDMSPRDRTPLAESWGALPGMVEATGGYLLRFLVPSGNPPFLTSPSMDRLTQQDCKNIASEALLLGREISEFYAVEVKLPETIDKERDWQLEVVGDIPEKHHLRVVYPHRLAACQ